MWWLENQPGGEGGEVTSQNMKFQKKNGFVFTMEGFVNKIQMVYQIEKSDVLLSGL